MKTSLIALGVSVAAIIAMAPAALAAPTVITFAAPQFAEPGRGDLLKEWIAKFNNEQSEVEVQAVGIPFSAYTNTIFTQIGGGQGPDVMRFDLTDYYTAADAGALAELKLDSDYQFRGPDQYLTVNGMRYGVLFEISSYALIYNAALLQGGQPPATFDEFVAAAQAATKDGNFGYAYRTTEAESGGMWYDLCNYVYGFGGRWTDGAGQPTIDTKEVIAGVTAFRDVYNAGVIPRGADAATYRRMFWEGKVAMEIDNGAVASILATQGEPQGIEVSATAIPFPTPAAAIIIAAIGVNKNTANQAAAESFIKWTLEPAHQQELQELMGASSVATMIDRSAEMLARWPWAAVYDAQAANGVPALPLGLESQNADIQQIIIQQVLGVLYSGGDVAAAMAEAQRQVVELVGN